MRLARPYIPIAVRLLVAERQCYLTAMPPSREMRESDGAYLKRLLGCLFGDRAHELHHRPALVNRRRYIRNGKTFYDPPANSAEHLIYLPADEHDIETRVRGIGAQRSDLGQARYMKKVAKNRAKRKAISVKNIRKIGGKPVDAIKATLGPPRKFKWPSRPLRSASRWPKGRKMK